MHVSVIATVFNEGKNLRVLLDSLEEQTRSPDEVVVVDGGSTDDTLAILEEYADGNRLPLRIISARGSNISQGRNVAIGAATGPIIAVTDAGVRLEPDWLEKLAGPIVAGSATAAGFFRPDPQTPFEVAMGATVLPAVADVNPDTFLPSSRSVAFLRTAWEAAGGYPEWLDYCEDLVFDLTLRELYGAFPFVPQAVALFRPRGSLKAFAVQYFRYARGDGKADLWRKRHFVRYVTYLVAVPLAVWMGINHSPWYLLLLLLGGAAYTWRPAQRLAALWGNLAAWQRLYALASVPVIRLVGDLAKMVGYPVGVWWRLTGARAQD
jgi:glycosyltransferase involved in cell wall biosynthesis